MDAATVRAIYDYCADTGTLSRRDNGAVVGTKIKRGYLDVCARGKVYRAHRLIWLWMTGAWPPNEIDHINGDKSDNRWCNLRAVTRAENMCNRRKYATNKSGYKGVSWKPRQRKWAAQLQINSRQIYLGYFDTPEKAYQAYCVAAKEHHRQYANLD